jgi:regulator of ribonuclease activity A
MKMFTLAARFSFFKVCRFKRAISSLTMYNTADLCDVYGDLLQYAEPSFRDFGQKTQFGGKVSTVKCHEDNSFVKAALAEPGEGKVIYI